MGRTCCSPPQSELLSITPHADSVLHSVSVDLARRAGGFSQFDWTQAAVSADRRRQNGSAATHRTGSVLIRGNGLQSAVNIPLPACPGREGDTPLPAPLTRAVPRHSHFGGHTAIVSCGEASGIAQTGKSDIDLRNSRTDSLSWVGCGQGG